MIVKGNTDELSPSSRLHLDLNTTDLDAGVLDLLTLGATLVSDHGVEWKTLQDPEGNVFCLRASP